VRAGSIERRFAAIVEELDIPGPFDLGQFLAQVKLRRQRMIFLHPFTSGPGVPCGMWIGTAEADHIFHEAGTSPWHKTHIVTHEIAHMLLGHHCGTQVPQYLVSLLAPDVDPALVRLVLGRTGYTTVEEQEAETLASLILEHSAETAAVLCRLERTWGRGHRAGVCGGHTTTPAQACHATTREYLRAMPPVRLEFISRQGRMWSTYWRLRPLWVILSRAAPDVQLPPQPGTRFNARYRLHRRVIEIRDAELALRPYWTKEVADHAADAARSARLPADRRDAVIEAAVIVTALDARLRGNPRRHDDTPAEPVGPVPQNDLGAEAARLILVSRAIRRSPIVRSFGIRPGPA